MVVSLKWRYGSDIESSVMVCVYKLTVWLQVCQTVKDDDNNECADNDVNNDDNYGDDNVNDDNNSRLMLICPYRPRNPCTQYTDNPHSQYCIVSCRELYLTSLHPNKLSLP